MGSVPPEEHDLVVPDGTHLHIDRYPARSGAPIGSVVFLHGFTMYARPYRHVAAAFAAAGLHVTALDVRGHGLSQGRRGHVRRFTDFVDDLEAVLEWTRARGGVDAPVAVSGHSHGGLIALAHAFSGRSRVSALALGAPWLGLTMKVPAVKRAASPVMGWLWPTLALSNGIRVEDVTRDPEVQRRLADDPLIHHVATARWFNESLSVQAHILAGAGQLSIPTFIGIPGEDRIASAETAASFADGARAAGAPVQSRCYPGVFHELFLEPERDAIIADLVTWTAETIASGVVPRHNPRIL
jgi:alpha-beta hydrolase superfamily lysophospholipase